MKGLVQLVSAIAAGYVVNGWPFLLAHLFVVYLVRNSWLRLSRERTTLENWNPPFPQDKGFDFSSLSLEGLRVQQVRPAAVKATERKEGLQTILLLEQFVEESRIMGAKGVFVPMTDFSDRLDSAVEGKIAELHDRTNLFLYVGIAGTMFGVFEFAFRSYSTLVEAGLDQTVKVAKLAEYLSGSMSKAFPVGFFGLLFTFVAQILATRPEQRLRQQLSEAARKALETRQHAIHSQAELLQQAAASIVTATEPLKDLKKTLSEGLQPLVDVFGQRLDRTLQLVQGHFKTVEETSTGLQSAVENLRQAVESIAGATSSLESLIKETPKIINRLVELEEKHERSLQKVDQLFTRHFEQADRVSEALSTAVAKLSTLSEHILKEASEGIKRVEEASVSGWTGAAENLRQKIESDLASLFAEGSARTADVAAAVQAAVETMNGLGQASHAALTAIAEIAPQISEGYKGSLEKVGTDSIALWKGMTDKFGEGTERAYLVYLDKVKQGTTKSSDALMDAATAWDSLARNAPRILREPVEAAVSEARKDLVGTIGSFDTNLANRITQFSTELTELQRSTGELVDKVGSINAGLRDWVKRVGPFLIEINAGSEAMKQQNRVQEKLVKRLDSTSDKLERTANRLGAQEHSFPSGKVAEPKVIYAPPPLKKKWYNPVSWRWQKGKR